MRLTPEFLNLLVSCRRWPECSYILLDFTLGRSAAHRTGCICPKPALMAPLTVSYCSSDNVSGIACCSDSFTRRLSATQHCAWSLCCAAPLPDHARLQCSSTAECSSGYCPIRTEAQQNNNNAIAATGHTCSTLSKSAASCGKKRTTVL